MRTLSMGCTLLFLLALACGAGCCPSRVAESGPPAGVPLENTYWKLLEVDGQPARVGDKSAEPYLQLDPAQKQAHGGTGCNLFSGRYELKGSSLRFGPLASTRRACLDPEMNRQETALLNALGATRTWQVTGDTLVLRGGTGQVVRFAAQDRGTSEARP